jgi:tripartite motif-containing protein 71
MQRSWICSSLASLLLFAPAPVRGDAAPVFLTSFGTYGAGNGQFHFPSGVVVGLDGTVYVLDSGNARVQMFDADGAFLFKWDTGWGGFGGIAVHQMQGSVSVINAYTGEVRRFSRYGVFETSFFSGGVGAGRSITVDGAGNVGTTWTETGGVDPGARLGRYTSGGAWAGQVARGDALWSATFHSSGDLLVRHLRASDGKPTIRRYPYVPGATLVCEWGAPGAGDGQFSTGASGGLGVDGAGNVYVADEGNHRVQVFDGCGAFLGKWGESGTSAGRFRAPTDVAVAPSGRIYVADRDNHRIQVFVPAASPVTSSTWGRIKSRYR